jgi:hypothetical protein
MRRCIPDTGELMSHPSLLVIFGLVLNTAASFIMLRWQVLPNAVILHPETRIWYEVGALTNKRAPHWKVSIARLGPALLLLGFCAQFLGTLFLSLGLD